MMEMKMVKMDIGEVRMEGKQKKISTLISKQLATIPSKFSSTK